MSERIISGIMLTLLIVSSLTIMLNAESTERAPLNYTPMASTSLPPSLVLLGGGARWAAGNGSSVLFINWRDNWLAHHLTDGSTWGPWSSESDMDNCTFSIFHTLNQFGLNVDFAGDIPENLDSYDLVVIYAYWAVEPKHEQLIRNYILNGGGVVILAGVPCYFAVCCKDWWPYRFGGDNLSPIQEWFGSWFYINTGGFANVTVDNPFGTALLKGDTLVEGTGYSCAAVTSLHNDTQVLAEWGTGPIFAFTHEYGQGRIYYQAGHDNIPVVAIGSISRTPTTPNYNEDVLVSVTIKDGVGVVQAFLSYTLGGAWHNVSMNKSGDMLNATIPLQPYGTPVQYKIYANDMLGRWVASPTYSYTVSDSIPPEIVAVDWTPTQPTPNDTVKVSANITEPVNASEVSKVLFSFMDCFGQWWNTTMTYDDESGLWNVIIPQQPHNTTVKFYIIAYDNAGNIAVDNNYGEYYVYTVLPEFASTIILLLALAFTALVVIIAKKKLREKGLLQKKQCIN